MSLPIEPKKTKEPESVVSDSFEQGSPRVACEDRYKSSVTFTDPPGRSPPDFSLDSFPLVKRFLEKLKNQTTTES